MHRLRRAGNLNKSLRKRRGKFVHRLEGEIEWKGEKVCWRVGGKCVPEREHGKGIKLI